MRAWDGRGLREGGSENVKVRTLSDNRILERGPSFKHKDSVFITALGLPRAADAAAVRLHAAVKDARDALGARVGDGALRGGNGERGALLGREQVGVGGGCRGRGDGVGQDGGGGEEGAEEVR